MRGPLKETNLKKQDSDRKRIESMRKMRQEFKDKKNIIKTGLLQIVSRKKIITAFQLSVSV